MQSIAAASMPVIIPDTGSLSCNAAMSGSHACGVEAEAVAEQPGQQGRATGPMELVSMACPSGARGRIIIIIIISRAGGGS
jgi:hypothetical protein